jgi:N-acetyl-D-muramate 6-phosphate phosphatase
VKFSQVTDDLFVGQQPDADDYLRLCEQGVRLVINMRGEEAPPAHAANVESLWLRTYDTPFTPIPLDKLEEGTRAALATIEHGGKVLAHCAGGRHRSVAMAAAILIAQGRSADAAMDLIAASRRRADPRAWYIQRQIRRFERRWWHGGAPPLDPGRVRALLFDLDGTLADTDDEYIQRAARWLRHVAFLFPGRDPKPLLRSMVMASETPLNLLMTVPDRLGMDQGLDSLKRFMHRVRGVGSPREFVLMDGARPMLERASQAYALALVTSRAEREANAFLDQFDLRDYFKTVITAFSAPRIKPHPAPVRLAAERLGVPVEACVMIGDTTVDILAGRRAGAQAIGLLCGFGEREELERAGANLILDKTSEIGGWLEAPAGDLVAESSVELS